MKKLLSILFLFTALKTNATNYYVSTTGSNANAGTSTGMSWLTVAYAAAHTVSGDIINIGAGTFTETQIVLPVGVNLIGTGDGYGTGTKITFSTNYSSESGGEIQLKSTGVNSTGQTISYIRFDGNNQTIYRGMVISQRSNVTIDHCTFIMFLMSGISFGNYSDPLCYNFLVSNCHFYQNGTRGTGDAGTEGDIFMTYQVSPTIHDNVFDNYVTTIQAQGYPSYNGNNHGNQIGTVRGSDNDQPGAIYGWKCYNNTFNRSPIGAGDGGFGMSMEIWRMYDNTEIYNNTFTYGGIDLCGFAKTGPDGSPAGAATYSCNIHNNTFALPSNVTWYDGCGIQTEAGSYGNKGTYKDTLISHQEDANFYNNTFTYCPNAIKLGFNYGQSGFTNETSNSGKRIAIYKNQFINCGETTFNASGQVLPILIPVNSSNEVVDSIFLVNNDFYGSNPYAANHVMLNIGGTSALVSRINISNNIFTNLLSGSNYVYANVLLTGAGTVTQFSFQNNLSYANTVAQNAIYYLNVVTAPSPTISNNLPLSNPNSSTYNPLYVSPPTNLTLQAGSPAINAGIDLGHGVDIGAIPYSVSIPTINFFITRGKRIYK